MKIEIKIPSIGESINEAIVASIIKPSGSLVKEGDEILELETDKVNQVLYAPKSGQLTLTVAIDQKVAIGEVIGEIDTAIQGQENTKKEAVKESKRMAPTSTTQQQEPRKETKFSHKVEEPISKQAEPKTEYPGAQRKRMSSLRKKIATRLVEVKNTTAMLTTFNEVDMSFVMDRRAKEQESFQKRYGVKLGFMSFFVKAVANALKEIPSINALIDGEDIVSFNTYHIGIAVSTERGLMVPVLRDCDKKTYAQIEQEIASFAQKSREGTISIEDLKGGSFTITNGGTFGSLLSTPIINPPQSAILGMHAIVKRPIAIEDQVVIRPMMYIALSYDHRLIDGKEAVQFLVSIKKSLEDLTKLQVEF